MTHRRLRLAVAVSVSVVLFGGVAPRAQQALRRSMYVSVLNQAGAPVAGLGPADFIVREDKRAREILSVEPATAPMQVALLVDDSARSSANIRDIREGANTFITAMTGTPMKNDLAVITVAERATILVDYTSDQARLLKGAGRIFPQSGSGAYMLDAILETAQGFRKREAPRPVIVALATNGPEFSNRSHDQVLDAVARVDAALHIVMVGAPPTDFASNEGRERALVFSEGPARSGGRYDNVLAASAVPDRMKQVADELTHQYLVTYARPDSLIPPEHITIEGRRADLTVRGTPVKVKDDRGSR